MQTIGMTMTAPEVAAALALSIDHFRHRRRALEALGFPRPLPGFVARWSHKQVSSWIAAGGVASAPTAQQGDFIAEQRSYLEARYAGRPA